MTAVKKTPYSDRDVPRSAKVICCGRTYRAHVGIDPADGLRLTCHVNGELVQSGSTDDLVFDVPTPLAAITEFTTLAPGDLVLTDTPGGVGAALDPPRFLHAGDVVECAIEGIGAPRTTIKEAA